MTTEPNFLTTITPSTLKIPPDLPAVARRFALRAMDADAWVEQHASGTLRKNKRLGFAWKEQYLHERVKYEFGDGFELLPASRVTIGRPYTEGDCKAITEAGWYIERYMTSSVFDEDDLVPAYIQAEFTPHDRREGIGIYVRKTSAPWIGCGKCLFAIVSPFDVVAGCWKDAENPF